MSATAFELRKKKNKLWKKFTFTGHSSDLSEFKKVRNEFRKLTRNLRKDYEKHLAPDIKNKPKAVWHYVNSRIKTRPTNDELHRPDNTTTSCDAEMAELFNSYFTSVFTQEDLSTIPVLQLETQPPLIKSLRHS